MSFFSRPDCMKDLEPKDWHTMEKEAMCGVSLLQRKRGAARYLAECRDVGLGGGGVMPIRPENKGRYPQNWKEIRESILERAGHKCEGSPAYPDCRAVNYIDHPVTGSRVVLTIAHLDHVPEHCDPANLAGMVSALPPGL